MNEPLNNPVDNIRNMAKTAQLIKEGEDGLAAHLLESARHARLKHGGLTMKNLGAFLADRECVRYPTRLVFEFGMMAPHQFAQPDVDFRDSEHGCVLYLRPSLGQRPDLLPLAVAYMLPAINYGEIINDEHCLTYGAALLGMTKERFYEDICKMADLAGAEAKPNTAHLRTFTWYWIISRTDAS